MSSALKNSLQVLDELKEQLNSSKTNPNKTQYSENSQYQNTQSYQNMSTGGKYREYGQDQQSQKFNTNESLTSPQWRQPEKEDNFYERNNQAVTGRSGDQLKSKEIAENLKKAIKQEIESFSNDCDNLKLRLENLAKSLADDNKKNSFQPKFDERENFNLNSKYEKLLSDIDAKRKAKNNLVEFDDF